MLCVAFLILQFGFEFFWRNKIGAKAARKMVLKLTTVQLADQRRNPSKQVRPCRRIRKSESSGQGLFINDVTNCRLRIKVPILLP
jgi:hypothetical protein